MNTVQPVVMNNARVILLLPGYGQASDESEIVDSHSPVSQEQGSVSAAGLRHSVPASFVFVPMPEPLPWQARLGDVLGLDTQAGQRLPAARLAAPDHTVLRPLSVNENNAALVRADPVSLKADRDTASLMASVQLALLPEDADELISSINAFLAQDGLMLYRQCVDEWYLHGLPADDLRAYPPLFLANRNASAFLPEGDAGARWRTLMTEIQMLLHSHPVNTRREARGLPPVNSLWFWGGADVPVPSAESLLDTVLLCADDAYATALAKRLGVQQARANDPGNLLQLFSDMSNIQTAVVVDTRLSAPWLNGDVDTLRVLQQQINDTWLTELAAAVSSGVLSEVHIYTEETLQGYCNQQTVFDAEPPKPVRRLWQWLTRQR